MIRGNINIIYEIMMMIIAVMTSRAALTMSQLICRSVAIELFQTIIQRRE